MRRRVFATSSGGQLMVDLISRGDLPRIILGRAGSRDARSDVLEKPSRGSLFSPEGASIHDDDPRTMDINGLLRRRLTRSSLDRVSWLL